jgi:hypothetical protein
VRVLARLSLAGLALIACAWFVLGIRQAHDLGVATSIAQNRSISPAQAAHAESLLDSAATLNPDKEVQLVRAQIASAAGNDTRAIALAQQVANAEPENVVAWYVMAQVSGSSGQLLLTAFRHIRELSPVVGHRH